LLILKRTTNQKIKIGNDITIVVTDAGNGWAKIGIDAPKEVRITRPDMKKGKAA
jgi:carbon storage regulator